MQISLNLTTSNHSAKKETLYADYENLQVCRRISADGTLTVRVVCEAANQVALRVALANAVISMVKEIDACGVSRNCLSSVSIGLVVGGAISRPSVLIHPGSERPFAVTPNILDEAGAIFVAGAKIERDVFENAVDGEPQVA